MSGLLKRKLFIQAVSTFNRQHEIQLNRHEYPSDAITTYITVGTTEVEFKDPKLTDEQFQELRNNQLEQLKSEIMETAKKQCEALT
tara:strand:- start:302 stop:559 length:258 start_codon:yes stop_codon:yes gene_type:complete